MNAARGWLCNARIVVCVIAAVVLASSTLTASGAASDPAGQPTPREQHFGGPGRNAGKLAPSVGRKEGAADPAGTEVPGRRTATSRTWKTDDGRFHTRVYSTPVNYRGADGGWHAIDDSLVSDAAAGYALQNASDRYRAAFPSELAAKPIELSQGGNSLGFRLLGAEGGPTASGATARYVDALPGVTAAYHASPDGVKEDLKLSNAGVATSYDYAVSLSKGLHLRENAGGGVDVVDASGGAKFSFEAPFAYDGAGARVDRGARLSLKVLRGGAHPRLRLALDPAWLKAADRRFPVVIDPSVSLGDNQDCYIAGGGGANTSYCGASSLKVGWDGTQAYRALLRFDLSGIPANSAITGAHMLAYLNSATTTNQTGVSAFQVTRPWTSGATWNKYDGTNAWTSAGGDVQGPATYTNPSAWGWPSTGTWYEWGASNLVQQWQDGVAPNYGVLLKEPVENVTNVMSYTSGTPSTSFAPYLQVDWEPKFMGDQAWYPMVGQTPLGDGQSLAVNADGGNLVAHSTDLHIAGVGLPFTLERTYNNLSPEMNSWGYGWQTNGGFDMWLDQHDDAQTFFDATGTPFRFTKTPTAATRRHPGSTRRSRPTPTARTRSPTTKATSS
jgi:hypothetical protein